MSEATLQVVIIAVLTALPSTIAASATLWVAVISSRKSDSLLKKSDVIHEQVNSNLAGVKTELEKAHVHIADLHQRVERLMNSAEQK